MCTTQQTIDAILQAAGVTVTCTATGVTSRDGWELDEWRFTLSNSAGLRINFEYFTGVGHREKPNADTRRRAAFGFQGLTEADKKGQTCYGRRYLAAVEKLRKPVTPHVAGLLYSLQSDTQACEQSFDEWCGDFGYDNDSIKAHDTYRACQRNGDQYRRLFNHAQREQIAEALQDY